MFDQHHISAAWQLFANYCGKRRFGSAIATVYKTNEIFKICTFDGTIGSRTATRELRSRAYIRGGKNAKTQKS